MSAGLIARFYCACGLDYEISLCLRASVITRFYCACGLNYKYVLCLRDGSIYCACEVVCCFAPVARCVLLGLVVFRVSQF